jgi:ribosomal protein S18 acetylase RimI-like enzyme
MLSSFRQRSRHHVRAARQLHRPIRVKLARIGSRAMASVSLVPASRFSHAELAEIFNAGYEGYYTPFTLDEDAFRFMSTIWDDDLDASMVALADGVPAGICKLAIRGDRGWIAGIGISQAHRGRGIGEELMRGVLDGARRRGLREVWLEVLVQNEPAIRLYEKLGFERARDLEVWILDSVDSGGGPAERVTLGQAQERIRRERAEREPWQRADETIAHLDEVEGLESEGGAVVFRSKGGLTSLLQGVARDEATARGLLQALGEAMPLQWLNGPEGDPFNAAIETLGGSLAHRQHELLLRLSP